MSRLLKARFAMLNLATSCWLIHKTAIYGRCEKLWIFSHRPEIHDKVNWNAAIDGRGEWNRKRLRSNGSVYAHGHPQNFFQGGSNVEILLILFRFLTMQRKLTYTKRFTLSTPQRNCPVLRQRLQTVLPLRRGFQPFSCGDPFCNPIQPDDPLPKISSQHM